MKIKQVASAQHIDGEHSFFSVYQRYVKMVMQMTDGAVTKKKGIKTSIYHKSKLCTCNFCNFYPTIQALLQHISAIVPIEHKSLHPNETLSTTYMSVLSKSLCSIRLTTTSNSFWHCEYMN